MESTPDQNGFLYGLRILDLADEKASFCTRLLADMGARVIKVEKPGGDASRNIGPFFKDKSRSKDSIPFFYSNTNKLAITLDLEQDKGQSVFSKLVADTDVVVHTFAPEGQIRLGLDYEALSSLNPKLILVSVTGFGQNGARSSTSMRRTCSNSSRNEATGSPPI